MGTYKKRKKYDKNEQVGLLFFIEEVEKRGDHRSAIFKCSCGKEFITTINSAKQKHAKSCGCIKTCSHAVTHNLCHIPEYKIWAVLKQRCNNPKVKQYKDYGGRGISYDPRWEVFENFINDMGIRPSNNHSIDRINPNGNYEKSNCRWATRKEQQRNLTTNVYIKLLGQLKCAAEWSEIAGIKAQTIQKRIKYGWADSLILTLPGGSKNINTKENRRIIKLHQESKKQPLPNYIKVEAAYD